MIMRWVLSIHPDNPPRQSVQQHTKPNPVRAPMPVCAAAARIDAMCRWSLVATSQRNYDFPRFEHRKFIHIALKGEFIGSPTREIKNVGRACKFDHHYFPSLFMF